MSTDAPPPETPPPSSPPPPPTPPAPAPVPQPEDWHERLLASLKDCGVQRAPRNAVVVWTITILFLVIFVVLTLVARQILRKEMAYDRTAQMIGSIVWTLFNLFVLIRIRNRLIRKAWMSSARSAEDEIARSGSRRPILYLRSFKLDERIGRISWVEYLLGTPPGGTAEQFLTKILRRQGPVIAIGRPDEQLPALGAARFYVSHDRWQEKVTEVVKVSQYVVWATGVTPGLRWEISHLIENLPPEKLILWCHPHLIGVDPVEREVEWTKFRTELGSLFPKPLPEVLGEARFIYFTSDWLPRMVAPPCNDVMSFWRAMRSPQDAALRALLDAKHGMVPEMDVVYLPPSATDLTPRSFRQLIGAVGPTINWLCVVAFFVAYLAWSLGHMIAGVIRNADPGYMSNYISGLFLPAAALSAAAAGAFRYFRRPGVAAMMAALAAVAGRLLYQILKGYPLMADPTSIFAFFCINWVLLKGLDWALRRVPNLGVALWVGAMLATMADWLFQYLLRPMMGGYQDFDPIRLGLSLFEPILFALVLSFGVKKALAPRT